MGGDRYQRADQRAQPVNPPAVPIARDQRLARRLRAGLVLVPETGASSQTMTA